LKLLKLTLILIEIGFDLDY